MENTRKTSTCPVSGLTVLRDPQWIGIKKQGYVYSYSKIGDAIVYLKNSGITKNFDPALHEGFMGQFVAETGIKTPYVEIRDLKNIKGRATPRQIAQTREYIEKNQNLLAGFVFCNMPFWVRSIARVGFKTYEVSTKFAACKDYEGAIISAVDILENRLAPPGELRFEQLEFRPGWQYESPLQGLSYRSGVIPGKIFYSQISTQNLQSEDVKMGLPFLEQVFKDGVLKGSEYIRIADYSGVKKSSFLGRRAYALALNRLNKQYGVRPKKTYVCGASLFTRSAIKLFSGFMDQRFYFMDSVSDAFAAINSQKEQQSDKDTRILVSQKDIDEINELCGMMVWPEEEIEKKAFVCISQDNPLIELSETMAMVRNDLRELRSGQAEQMKHIEQARKEADAANLVKNQFLANMSHEIRTPMNGVMGMLDILKETQLTAEQRHYLEIARQSSTSLLGVVNDILDFSKVEAGKMEIETIGFDLRATMDSIGDVLSVMAYEGGIEFGCLVSKEVPTFLKSDPGRLRQILTNLIKNAIKFVSKGEVFVRVSLEKEFRNQVTLLFEVMDTGIGIPEDKINRLFEPFTQVDVSTTRLYGGTGLGLAISKQLVETMGGKIGVESRVGKGSRFWFTHTAQKQEALEGFPENRKHQFPGTRILVVDRHPVNDKIYSAYFQEWSCRHMRTDNMDPVLELLEHAAGQKDPFHLVFVDAALADTPLDTWVQSIRSRDGLKQIALILISPPGRRGQTKNNQNQGFDGYLSKPIKKQPLLECLETALGIAFDYSFGYNRPAVTGEPVPGHKGKGTCPGEEFPNKPLRILLVEDNAVNQKVVVLMLSKPGYDVRIAPDGARAIEMFQNNPFDLVLMDIQMPVMGGLEATQKIRLLERKSRFHIPIVALTANVMKGDREKYLAAGMDGYLSKPIQKRKLIEMIDNLCRTLNLRKNV
ncbi:MAG: response regulator [Proteobacteria bacterium]|nr:response regulator [Pseudomonadota bacterium]